MKITQLEIQDLTKLSLDTLEGIESDLQNDLFLIRTEVGKRYRKQNGVEKIELEELK